LCSTPKILKMFLISNMKKLLNLILSLLHSVEWLIIVSLFWKLLLYLHRLKFEFHKHVPSNCKTLSDLFYTNRPHLSNAGKQGEKIERFWKKACSRRRPRWSYRLRGTPGPVHKARRKCKHISATHSKTTAGACILQPYLHSTLFNFPPQRLHLQAYLHSTLHSTLLQGEHQTSRMGEEDHARTQQQANPLPPSFSRVPLSSFSLDSWSHWFLQPDSFLLPSPTPPNFSHSSKSYARSEEMSSESSETSPSNWTSRWRTRWMLWCRTVN